MGGQAKLFGCSEMEVDKRIIEAGGSQLISSLPQPFLPLFQRDNLGLNLSPPGFAYFAKESRRRKEMENSASKRILGTRAADYRDLWNTFCRLARPVMRECEFS